MSSVPVAVSTAQPLVPKLAIIPLEVSAAISVEGEEGEEGWELVPTVVPDIQHLHPKCTKPSSMTSRLRTGFLVHLLRLRAKKSI